MKHTRFIMAFVAGMLLFANSLLAYDFSAVSNGTTIYYNITSNTIPYTVEVTWGTTSIYNNNYTGSVVIPSSVSCNGRMYNVTSIGNNAFSSCTTLTAITIPNSVTSIGNSAFFDCTGLTSVTIPSSVTRIGMNPFAGCTSLMTINIANGNNHFVSNNGILFNYAQDTLIAYPAGKIGGYTIPSTVTNIGSDAFRGCSGLTSVTIGNSVTSFGDEAFSDCSGLTSITIPNSVTSIGLAAFHNCSGLTSVTIGNSVTSIVDYAFLGCTGLRRTNYTGTIAQWCDIDFGYGYANPIYYSRNLYINNQLVTNLVIPNTVDTIKQFAFYWDTCITSVTIPNSVTIIGESAFNGCTGLTSITIPNSVTSIEGSAFSYCTGLTSVTIGNSVTSIGVNAFSFCTGLTTVNFNADSCIFMGGIDSSNSRVSPVFWEDYNLTTLNIGNNVKIIPDAAFCYAGLTSVTIPNAVKYIGRSAFAQDTNLTTVTIGRAVDSIGVNAFWGCTGLTTVNFNADSCRYMGYASGNMIYFSFGQTDTSFTTLNIGSNVKAIPDYAFAYCRNLRHVNLTDSLRYIGKYALARTDISGNITIGNNVRSVEYAAFWDCQGITSVSIAAENIGEQVFAYDSNITSLTLGNTVTTIDKYAFNRCGGLTSVTIPSSVITIGDSAFRNCFGITSVTFRRSNTMLGSCNFNGLPAAMPIYIPCGSSAWYINKLPNFSNFIEELQYTYSVISQDTAKGTVASITAPTCNTPSWTISATANTGYTFSRWSDGNTQNPRTITVTQDTALVAYFTANTPQWYRFSVVSEDTLKGTVQIITQPTQANPQAIIMATANNGYTFTHWSDGNTQNPRSLTVTQDTALVAYFRWYDFIVSSEDTAKGTVQVLTQPSQSNPQATFVALPNTGYTFSRWSDGNTQNPRSITVTQDTILIAFFTSTQGIAEAENASITIYPNPASDKVTLEGIGNEADIFIINALGKVVRRLENAGGTITFSVGDLPKGIYFVRVGNAVRKLVVD